MQDSSRNRFAIIYFSSTDWDSTWQRPQQLTSRLTRSSQVLYVNSLGLRAPLLTDLGRILKRVGSAFIPRTKPSLQPELTLLSPLFFLPIPSSRWAGRVNGWLIHHALARWVEQQGARPLVLWVGIPSPAVMEAIKHLPPGLVVYDCIDNFAAFHRNRPDIDETEQRLASTAGIVFATSAELFEKMKRINSQTFLVPNAVDFIQFRTAAKLDGDPPPDMAPLGHPVLGYAGEIAEWFDSELVHDLAAQNPTWSIVLIGRIHVDISRILRLPNVHYLGLKSYADIPSYMRQFDVCLLPFKISPLTNAVNPIKFYEYLAMGKPVVSTPIREIQHYSDTVEIADRSEFTRAVKRALATSGDEDKIAKRLKIAQDNTWDKRIEEIFRILDASLGST